jgi:hypothetical protein
MKSYCFFHVLLVLLCITVYMVVCFVCFYLILYIMYSYCYVCSVLGNVFRYDILCIVYVQMCAVLLPPAVNPIAFTTYIKSSVSCLIPVRSQTILWLVLSGYPAFGGHLIAHAFRNSIFTAPHVCYNATTMFNYARQKTRSFVTTSSDPTQSDTQDCIHPSSRTFFQSLILNIHPSRWKWMLVT